MRRRLTHAVILGLALGALTAASVALLPVLPAAADPPREGWPPDPPPAETKKQWFFEVRSEKSVPNVVKVSAVEMEKATSTPRDTGRYAFELYVGRELLDRVRFNVPLAGDDVRPNDQPGKKRPEFRVNTKFFVRMADSPRATMLRLVDRATGDIQLFEWPPSADGKLVPWVAKATEDKDAGDAGASDDAGSSDDAGASDDAAPAEDAGSKRKGGKGPRGFDPPVL